MVTLCAHIYLLDQDRVAIKFAVHREGTIAVTQILVHSFTDKCKICAKLIKLDRSCVAVRERERRRERMVIYIKLNRGQMVKQEEVEEL